MKPFLLCLCTVPLLASSVQVGTIPQNFAATSTGLNDSLTVASVTMAQDGTLNVTSNADMAYTGYCGYYFGPATACEGWSLNATISGSLLAEDLQGTVLASAPWSASETSATCGPVPECWLSTNAVYGIASLSQPLSAGTYNIVETWSIVTQQAQVADPTTQTEADTLTYFNVTAVDPANQISAVPEPRWALLMVTGLLLFRKMGAHFA